MRHLALASIATLLTVGSVAAQQSSGRLGRALDCVERNNVNELRRLLQEDPSLVRRTEAGVLPHWRWTLLHLATADPSLLAIVAALVDAGADVTARDNEGNTPLHFAMKRIGRERLPVQDYEGIIRLLLEKKADVHAVNIGGATPLHTASAFRADASGVELLLRAGADVNRRAPEAYGGWTPLHGAAARGSDTIVAALLKHGADRTAKDAKGLTALQVAEQGGFVEAARILRLAAPTSTVTATATPTVTVSTTATRPVSTSGTVQGRVVWNGQPIAGAIVYVADDFKAGSVRYGTVTTDEQGRFFIPGVPANNESVTSRPILQWNPYPDAVRYVATVLSPTAQVVYTRGAQGQPLTETSVQVDVALAPGGYQWRVSAFNAAGQMIGCSYGPSGFTVRSQP